MRALHRAALWLPLILLSGCASLREPPAPVVNADQSTAAWVARQEQLGAMRGFELTGRVAVKGAGLSGALRWQQTGETFNLRIAGPFGAGALSMQGTPALVAIRGKDIDLTTTEPELVLAERTGWRLPMASLRWWVLGLPAPPAVAPAAERIAFDAEGRALDFQQNGWTLRYSGYRAFDGNSEGVATLPARIEATQTTASGDWMATVILENLVLTP